MSKCLNRHAKNILNRQTVHRCNGQPEFKMYEKIKWRINHKAELTQTRHKCIVVSNLRTGTGVWHHPCFPMGRIRSNVEHWHLRKGPCWPVKLGIYRSLFMYLRLFNTVYSRRVWNLHMTGLELGTTGVRSNRCANWATTTTFLWAHKWCYFYQTM